MTAENKAKLPTISPYVTHYWGTVHHASNGSSYCSAYPFGMGAPLLRGDAQKLIDKWNAKGKHTGITYSYSIKENWE